jgi:hypothetical protein
MERGGEYAATVGKRKRAVRFARVAVKDAPLASAALVLLLVLRKGRRAEIQMGGGCRPREVLGVLARLA